jgi:hypothetical protein
LIVVILIWFDDEFWFLVTTLVSIWRCDWLLIAADYFMVRILLYYQLVIGQYMGQIDNIMLLLLLIFPADPRKFLLM